MLRRYEWRPLVLLAVLMSHTVIVLLVIRVRPLIFLPKASYDPLVFLFFNDKSTASPIQMTLKRAPNSARKPASPQPQFQNAPSAITMPPEPPSRPKIEPQPKVDWEREAEMAARNALADAVKEGNYRDLSALSAAQLSWAKKNHMQPMPPGIRWTHPRVQFDRDSGLPMIWINDHCVLVTLLVFCSIGKIDANGGLFKHMRDPRSANAETPN